MGDMMTFPKRWEDFLHDYEFEDARRIYTNGSRLIPSFRVKQMMEHYAPVVHGRWEPYFEEVEIYNAGGVAERKQTGWICGRCKSVESITRYYKTNYCPNCGSKME